MPLVALKDHQGVDRALGALREPPPPDAWKYPVPAKAVASSLPTRCVVMGVHSVHDQGGIGSCVLNAFATVLERLCRLDGLKVELSRLQGYYDCREVRGWENQDTGCFPEDAVRVLSEKGLALEALWEYVESKFTVKPPSGVYAQAVNHRIKNWYRAESNEAIMAAVAFGADREGPNINGNLVAHSFSVPNAYTQAWNTGMWIPDANVNDDVGGHEEVWIGYDRSITHPGYGEPGVFFQLNSWGEDGGITLPEYPQFRGGFVQVPMQEVRNRERWWDTHVCTLFETE